MLKFCIECDKRKECTELCKKAEEYVSQDNVVQTEYISTKSYHSLENFYDNNVVWNRVNINKNRIKNLIMQLTEDGKSTTNIAYMLPCSTSYIRRIRRRYIKKQKKGV